MIPYSTVATAPSPADSGTTLSVRTGTGQRFPAVPFSALVWAAGARPLATNSEQVTVTAVSTDQLTITRAAAPRTIVVGDQIVWAELGAHLYDAHIPALDSISDGFIESGAGIAYSKLNLTGSIVNADIANSAAIAYSKLNLANSVVNGDIVSLAWSKLTGTPTTLAGYGIASPLPPNQGGTGTGTVFTAGSVVFAGASGIYDQDHANFSYDKTTTALAIAGTPVAGAQFTLGGTSGTWAGNPGSTIVLRATGSVADPKDVLQVWPLNNPGNQGPAVRFGYLGDMNINRSIKISGSTISGSIPQTGNIATMLAVQADLGAGYPVVILEGNISADLLQPFISGYGDAVERWHVDTHAAQWLRGPAAGLEITRSGGSGAATLRIGGAPTSSADGVTTVDVDIYTDTGVQTLVGRLGFVEETDTTGARLEFSLKTPGGSFNEVARMTPTLFGVGTNAPASRFHVAVNAAPAGNGWISTTSLHETSTSHCILALARSRGTVTAPTIVSNGDGIGAVTFAAYNGSAYQNTVSINATVDGTFSSGQRPPSRLEFYTNVANGAQTLRAAIKSDGKIGFGSSASAPVSIVHTATDVFPGGTGAIAIVSLHETSTSHAILGLRKSRGSFASPTILSNGDGIGAIGFTAYDGSAYQSTAAINATVDGTFSSSQRPPSRLEFYTNVANGAQTLRMTIKGDGNVGIGTTSPGAKLDLLDAVPGISNSVKGIANIYSNDSQAIDKGGSLTLGGYITGTGTARNFAGIAGLKENGTSANEQGYLAFLTNNGGTLTEAGRFDSAQKLTLAGKLTIGGVANLKNYTVATLPAGTRGDVAYVTDATAPAFLTAVVGGGAVVTPVFYDGTNWVAF